MRVKAPATVIVALLVAGCATGPGPDPGAVASPATDEKAGSAAWSYESASPQGIIVLAVAANESGSLVVITTSEASHGNDYRGAFVITASGTEHVIHGSSFRAAPPGNREGTVVYARAGGHGHAVEGEEATTKPNVHAGTASVPGGGLLVVIWARQPSPIRIDVVAENATGLELLHESEEAGSWRLEDPQQGVGAGVPAARAHFASSHAFPAAGGMLLGFIETLVTDKGEGSLNLVGEGRTVPIPFSAPAASNGCVLQIDWSIHHVAWRGDATLQVDYAGYGPSTGVFALLAPVPASLLDQELLSRWIVPENADCVNG